MLAELHTFSLLGLEAVPVDVEVDVSPATMPKTSLMGLPEAVVQESPAKKHRSRAAMLTRKWFAFGSLPVLPYQAVELYASPFLHSRTTPQDGTMAQVTLNRSVVLQHAAAVADFSGGA